MNGNMLRATMILNGERGGQLAEAMSLSYQRLSAKLNETKGAQFTQREIAFIKDRYKLTAEQVDEIFFTKKVS